MLKNHTVREMEIKIPVYNDVWMDNAVENLYRLIEDFEAEVDINFDKTMLTLNTKNKEDFEGILTTIIQNNRNNLIVMDKDKKSGEIKEIKKRLCSHSRR